MLYCRYEPYHHHHSITSNLKRKDRSSDNEPADQLIDAKKAAAATSAPLNQLVLDIKHEEKSIMADKERLKVITITITSIYNIF